MKKTVEKLAALVMVGAMALSLAACGASKKQVEPKDFEKTLEKAGFIVEEDEDEDAEECRVAYYSDEDNEEGWVILTYYLFKSSSDARSCFNASYDDLKEEKDKGKMDGTTSKNSWKFTGEGEFNSKSALGEGEYYVVGVVGQKMVIIGYATGDKASKKVLDKALSDLGYGD
ncbi:MAG: hypothetical protein IK020_12150 [Clostridiales bacterium]|nr:hypothetical protein [Clostridiales bacterium]